MMSFSAYARICERLQQAGLVSVTASEALRSTRLPAFVLKHDVESNLGKALSVAEIEAAHGHKATYYVHGFFTERADSALLSEIETLGHEIGYHYDVLDECNGDYELAEKQFAAYLDKFRGLGFQIRTICPHGNPLKKRDGWRSNKDFFKKPWVVDKYGDIFDIVNQLESKLGGGVYYSDAGFRLRIIGDIRSNDATTNSAIDDGTLADFEQLAASDPSERRTTIVSIHPHRMSRSAAIVGARKAVFFVTRKIVRIISRSSTIRAVLSPLFRIAKKF